MMVLTYDGEMVLVRDAVQCARDDAAGGNDPTGTDAEEFAWFMLGESLSWDSVWVQVWAHAFEVEASRIMYGEGE